MISLAPSLLIRSASEPCLVDDEEGPVARALREFHWDHGGRSTLQNTPFGDWVLHIGLAGATWHVRCLLCHGAQRRVITEERVAVETRQPRAQLDQLLLDAQQRFKE